MVFEEGPLEGDLVFRGEPSCVGLMHFLKKGTWLSYKCLVVWDVCVTYLYLIENILALYKWDTIT